MNKIIPSIVLLAFLLAGCEPKPSDTTCADTSCNFSESSGSSSDNSLYIERIAGMADVGVDIGIEDRTLREVAEYDASAALGSAAHPLSRSTSEYIEITTFEQPDLYGDAYLFQIGDATIAMDFGNHSSSYFSDGASYSSLLRDYYSRYINADHLDLLILSHPHSDHYGGYPALKAEVDSVGMIVDYGYYASGAEGYRRDIRDYYVSSGAQYHRIYDMVNNIEGGMDCTYITSECFIDWLDAGYYQDVYADGPTVDDENVTSVAGILSYRNFTFFFSGDLQDNSGYSGTGGLGETNLVSLNDNNDDVFHTVTMMKAGHHGSSKASNNVLLNVLEPKVVTISAGAPGDDTEYNGKYGVCGGHPHYDALARFLTQGFKRAIPKIYLNFLNGTTSFVSDGLNDIYMEGSPLKTSYSGSSSNGEIAKNYGDSIDIYKEMTTTEWAYACHGL